MASKKNKGQKVGRNQKWCQAYRASGRREVNRAKRLARHLRLRPHDKVAQNAMRKLANTHLARAGVKPAGVEEFIRSIQ